MTVVLQPRRVELFVCPAGKNAVIAIGSQSLYDEFALHRPPGGSLRRHPGLRFRWVVRRQRGVPHHRGLRLLGVRGLGRKKAERGQNEKAFKAKVSGKAMCTLPGANTDAQTRSFGKGHPSS